MNKDIFGVIILITLIGFIGYFYFNEKLTFKKSIGILFAIIAIILFMSDHNHSH